MTCLADGQLNVVKPNIFENFFTVGNYMSPSFMLSILLNMGSAHYLEYSNNGQLFDHKLVFDSNGHAVVQKDTTGESVYGVIHYLDSRVI